MDDEPKESETADFAGRTILHGWLVLAVVIACLLSVCSVAYLIDELRSPRAVLSHPPRFQLDINQATAAQLQALPNVGVRLANRIVRYRSEHGPFHRVSELQAVRGIGPTTIARLGDMLIASGVQSGLAESHADPASVSVNQLSANSRGGR